MRKIQRDALREIQDRLFDWRIPHLLGRCANSLGMSDREFADFYREFILANIDERDPNGELVLADPDRVRLRGFVALYDGLRVSGLPSDRSNVIKLGQGWARVPARSRPGKDLGWYVYMSVCC
jgi:hypothetical protein